MSNLRSSKRSEERRKIIMISGGVAAASFTALSIGPKHAIVIWVYGALLLAAAGYVILQMVNIKRAQRKLKAERARREGQA